jgi:hypothetical protein
MKQFPIDVFGTRWAVHVGSYDEMPSMSKHDDGDSDSTIQVIQIVDVRDSPNEHYGVDRMAEMRETLRHEIAHAAMMECSLLPNREFTHEQIADWVATKHHALHAIIASAESTLDLLMKEDV